MNRNGITLFQRLIFIKIQSFPILTDIYGIMYYIKSVIIFTLLLEPVQLTSYFQLTSSSLYPLDNTLYHSSLWSDVRTYICITESRESKYEVLSISAKTVVRFGVCCRACHRRSSSWFFMQSRICIKRLRHW